MKKIAVVLLFVSFFLGGFFTSQVVLEKQIKTISAERDTYKALSQKIKECPKQECKQDVKLTAEKEKVLENVVESKIHFTAQKQSVSPTVQLVTIMMVGGSAMKVDAADLVMNYSNNLKISTITPGKAFPTFPRTIAENGVFTVTGVATIGSDGIVMGTPNEVYVTFEVEKVGDIKGTITLDKANTKAFLQGNAVLDEKHADIMIEL